MKDASHKFIFNRDSHVGIEFCTDDNGQLLLTVSVEEKSGKMTTKTSVLPEELCTEQAMRMWNVCMEKKWIDEKFQPLISQNKAAILASVISSELGLTPKWAAFENLWKITNLANKLSRSQDCSYYCDFIQTVEDSIV